MSGDQIINDIQSEADCTLDHDKAVREKVTDQMQEYISQYPPKQGMELIHKTECAIGKQKRQLT